MIKIVAAQLDIIPGNIRKNWENIEKEITFAREQKAQILVFPEMCLSGYLIGDMWDQPAFLRECEAYNQRIINASTNLTIIWGNVAVDWEKTGNDGRVRKYNAAFAAFNKKLIPPVNSNWPYTVKTLLPNYRQFDDPRYFTSMAELAAENHASIESTLQPFELPLPYTRETLTCGILLCEDSWDENYPIHPMEILKDKEARLFINLSASPFTLKKNEKRHRMLSASVQKLYVPMLYVNQRGMQNNGKDCYIFDGQSAAYTISGELSGEAAPFTEAHSLFLFHPETGHLSISNQTSLPAAPTLCSAMQYGVASFLRSIHMDKVVIGVSGGIDSAVNAALYRSVLPKDNLLLVNTPTRFNSETTKGLARQLAENLECPYVSIPIGNFVQDTCSALNNLPIASSHGETALQLTPFMMENIQARDRSSRILAALSAQFHGIFTCNANKTELSIGYGTLYGDLAGAFAATADLWKYQIYQLGHELNDWFGREVIPEAIFTIKPSAELSDNQAIDKGLGDPLIYEYHDYLLKSFIEPWNRACPEDLLRWYTEGSLNEHIGTSVDAYSLFPTPSAFIADLERWWNLFSGFAVAKRIQAPPLLAISRRSYGYDLREAQMSPYYTDAYLKLKQEVLGK